MADPSLLRFRLVIEAALAQLEARREEVNDLNVFPVADGDTGDNMALTLRAVLHELDNLSTQGEIDEIGREEIVDSVARAALLGARGNSGVILCQLIRGAAEELISRPGELVDPVLVAAAMARAADRAYGSVREPAEGTILTVVREMAARATSEIAHMDEPRLQHRVDDATQNEMLAYVLEHALDAGQASVKRGPELLPILRDAGVVDAGGYGLTIIFAGVIAALRGNEPPPLEHHVARPDHAPAARLLTYRYCTNFAVTGEGLDPCRGSPRLERLGDSVLVVGDAVTLKVHVHTDEPERATDLFDGVGEVSRLDVADMYEQVEQRTAARPRGVDACGVLAVVSGAGMRALFEGMGARVLDGGATLNPSTYELLAGIHEVPAEEVVVLPNSPNVRMAAERAAELSEKRVRVVPTRSMAAGLAAAVALDPSATRATNAAAMEEAVQRVRTGGVTEAARDDTQGRFRRGDCVGFIDEELVAWGEPGETLEVVLGELGREAELLTVIEGDGAPLGGDAVRRWPPRARVELERRRPAGLVVAGQRGVAGSSSICTVTGGYPSRHHHQRTRGAPDQPSRHAAEQHPPHRPVAARAADEQVALALVERRQLVDHVAFEQLVGRGHALGQRRHAPRPGRPGALAHRVQERLLGVAPDHRREHLRARRDHGVEHERRPGLLGQVGRDAQRLARLRRCRRRPRRSASPACPRPFAEPRGATATGQIAPCSSRSPVEPGEIRRRAPRGAEPTTIIDAPSASATRRARARPSWTRRRGTPPARRAPRGSARACVAHLLRLLAHVSHPLGVDAPDADRVLLRVDGDDDRLVAAWPAASWAPSVAASSPESDPSWPMTILMAASASPSPRRRRGWRSAAANGGGRRSSRWRSRGPARPRTAPTSRPAAGSSDR